MKGWFGVDLDGTLAEYHGWKGEEHIGAPIARMVEFVHDLIAEGKDVRIFTARVENGEKQVEIIKSWCITHIGVELPVTNVKDFGMICLYDDRVVQVKPNIGEFVMANDDKISHPSHYTHGKIEVISVIEDWKLGWHLSNVIKYVGRFGHKDSDLEDLKKARWYLDRKIKRMESGDGKDVDGNGRD